MAAIMKPFWVYILRCADGSYYTGYTDDLDVRVAQHQHGAIPGCYTLNRRPLALVFSQPFETREEALSAERQIKGWSRSKKEAMMRGDWMEVSRLARSAAESVHGSTSSPRTDSGSE
jgi:predicted GIY-YIG superfamily endonuclease